VFTALALSVTSSDSILITSSLLPSLPLLLSAVEELLLVTSESVPSLRRSSGFEALVVLIELLAESLSNFGVGFVVVFESEGSLLMEILAFVEFALVGVVLV
jgi:hypothetical protein